MKRLTLTILAAVSLGFAACEYPVNTSGGGEGELEICINALDFGRGRRDAGRAVENGYATAFTSGDTIGITVVDGGGVVTGQDNIPYTFDGTAWTTASATPVKRRSAAAYLVYYPYHAGMTGKTTETDIAAAFSPQDDQSDYAAGYTASDLMTGTGSVSGAALTVALAHKMALVEVTVPAGATGILIKKGADDITGKMYAAGDGVYRYLVSPAGTAALSGDYTLNDIPYVWEKTAGPLEPGKYAGVTVSTRDFTVTFNSNGSIGGSVPAPMTQADGTAITLPGNTGGLVKTDCKFVGWNTQADGLGADYPAGAPPMTPAGAITLYAQWEGWKVTTIAGDGTAAWLDEIGNAAQFNNPYGITRDSAGNLFVAELGGNRIRKIDTFGNVSTIAGDGTADWLDATGTNAKFNRPTGITVDNTGNLFVADRDNHRIRKIDTSTGAVTTVAGLGGAGGFQNANGTSARFNQPWGITIDDMGNLFVADRTNFLIRKIDTDRNVTTVAGSEGAGGFQNANGTSAKFNFPGGITIDGDRNLFVADTGNNIIRKIDTNRNVTSVAGSTSGFVDGNGNGAKFNSPTGITIDGAGNLFVADAGNHRIRKIDRFGNVTTIAGAAQGYADGTGTAAQFNSPAGITVDGAGNLFVADLDNHRIRKITWQRIY